MILLSKLWNKINFTCLYKKAIIKFYIEFEECVMFFLVQAPLMKYQKKNHFSNSGTLCDILAYKNGIFWYFSLSRIYDLCTLKP